MSEAPAEAVSASDWLAPCTLHPITPADAKVMVQVEAGGQEFILDPDKLSAVEGIFDSWATRWSQGPLKVSEPWVDPLCFQLLVDVINGVGPDETQVDLGRVAPGLLRRHFDFFLNTAVEGYLGLQRRILEEHSLAPMKDLAQGLVLLKQETLGTLKDVIEEAQAAKDGHELETKILGARNLAWTTPEPIDGHIYVGVTLAQWPTEWCNDWCSVRQLITDWPGFRVRKYKKQKETTVPNKWPAGTAMHHVWFCTQVDEERTDWRLDVAYWVMDLYDRGIVGEMFLSSDSGDWTEVASAHMWTRTEDSGQEVEMSIQAADVAAALRLERAAEDTDGSRHVAEVLTRFSCLLSGIRIYPWCADWADDEEEQFGHATGNDVRDQLIDAWYAAPGFCHDNEDDIIHHENEIIHHVTSTECVEPFLPLFATQHVTCCISPRHAE